MTGSFESAADTQSSLSTSSSKVESFHSPSQPPPSLSYEDLHRKCRDVLPICFEGAKFIVSKGLSSHFQVFL